MSLIGFIIGILASLFASCAILLGARFTYQSDVNHRAEERLTSLLAIGAGVFITVVLLDFIPDAWAANPSSASWWIFGGVLLLWSITQVVDALFLSYVPAESVDAQYFDDGTSRETMSLGRASAIVLIASLSFHTFLEGAALAVSVQQVNLDTTLFVFGLVLHKLPEGVLWAIALKTMRFGVGANPTRHLLRVLSIPALCTLLGTLLGMFLGEVASNRMIAPLTAIVAGSMLYICMSELFPSLRESSQRVRRVWIWFLTGVILMLIPIGIGHVIGG